MNSSRINFKIISTLFLIRGQFNFVVQLIVSHLLLSERPIFCIYSIGAC